MRRPLLLALVLSLALCGSADAARPKALTVVQANVGNIDGACADQAFKLCLRPVEARAAKALRALKPDVVGLEEILPDARCTANPSTIPANLCSSPRTPASQVTRLLGTGYAVSCDRRFGWDCLAVRRASGVRVQQQLVTRPVLGVCDDRGFTLNLGRLGVGGQRVSVGVAHPNSSATEPACRAEQLRDVFGRVPARGPALVLGDFNLDPYREHDASVDAFDAARKRLGLRLATGRTFSLLPGTSMTDPTGEALDQGPSPFGPPFSQRAIDHVLVRGFSGRCGRPRRIDGGGGMDHRAQVCRLRLERD